MAGKEIVFGIKIKATEVSPGVWQHVSEEIKETGEESEEAGKKSKTAADETGKSVVKWTALMQIGKKVVQETIQALSAWIDSSLKARAETDAGALAWKHHAEELEKTRALLGDILVPIILAMADAFAPLLDAFQAWLQTNRNLIGSGLVEWLVSVAKFLTDVILVAVVLVTKAWAGWSMLIDALRIAFSELVSASIEGWAMLLEGAAAAARAVGKDGLAGQIDSARDALLLFKDASDEVAQESRERIEQTIRDQEALEASVLEVRDAIHLAFDVVGAAAVLRYRQEVQLASGDSAAFAESVMADMQRDELYRAARFDAEMRREADLKTAALARSNLNEAIALRGAEQAEASAKLQADKAREIQGAFTSAYHAISGAVVDAFKGIGETVDGHKKTVADAMGQLFGNLGQLILKATADFLIAKGIEMAATKAAAVLGITAKAADAAAGAASSQAAIPIVGPGLAIAAMVAMLATVGALASGFNTGGVVGRGSSGPNRDSVLTMATTGEAYLDRDATAYLIRALSGRGGAGSAPPASSQNPDPRGGLSSGGGTAKFVPIPVPMFGPPTRTDTDRINSETIRPSQKRLERLRKV